jgi:hypothetical protein
MYAVEWEGEQAEIRRVENRRLRAPHIPSPDGGAGDKYPQSEPAARCSIAEGDR